MDRDVAHHVGAGHRVVHAAGGEQLPGLTVVGDLLDQDLADALGEPAMHLALEGQGIDHRADIIDDDITDEADRTGLGIDFHLADVAAIGEGGAIGGISGVLVKAGLHPGRQPRRLE